MSVREAEEHTRSESQHTDAPHRTHVRRARDRKAAVNRPGRDLAARANGRAVRKNPGEVSSGVGNVTGGSVARVPNDPDRPSARRGRTAGRVLIRVRAGNGLPARAAEVVSEPRGVRVRRAPFHHLPFNPNQVSNRHPGTPPHSQFLPKKERSVSMTWTSLRR